MTTGCTRRVLRGGTAGSVLELDAAEAARGRAAPAAWNSPRRVTPQQRAQDVPPGIGRGGAEERERRRDGEVARRVLGEEHQAVPLDVVLEHVGALDRRGGVDVAEAAGGDVREAPAARTAPPRQVDVLVVHEEPLVEEADVAEVVGPEQHAGAAPGEDLLGLVVLNDSL